MQILRHKKRSPLFSRQCCQVLRFSPRFEEFTLVMGNFSSDLEKFVSNLNFKRNYFIFIWRIFESFSNFRTTHLATLLPRLRWCCYDALLWLVEKRSQFLSSLRSHLSRRFPFRRSERREAKHVPGFWCHKASFWCAHRKPRKLFASSSQVLSLLVSRQKTPLASQNFWLEPDHSLVIMSHIAQAFEFYQEWILLEEHSGLTGILPCVLPEGLANLNLWVAGGILGYQQASFRSLSSKELQIALAYHHVPFLWIFFHFHVHMIENIHFEKGETCHFFFTQTF